MKNSLPKVQGALGDKVQTKIIIDFEPCRKDTNCASEEEKEKFWDTALPTMLIMHRYVDF